MEFSESSSIIEAEGWSGKTFVCNLGRNILSSSNSDSFAGSYCTMRYDFKPASLSAGDERHADVNVNKRNGEVTVAFNPASNSAKANSNQDALRGGKRPQIFKGNMNPALKECVLIYDRETGEFTIERVEAAVRLKQTREPRSNEQLSSPGVSNSSFSRGSNGVNDSTKASTSTSRSAKRKLESLSDNEDEEQGSSSDNDRRLKDNNGVDEKATRRALDAMTTTLTCTRLANDLQLSEESSDDDDDDDEDEEETITPKNTVVTHPRPNHVYTAPTKSISNVQQAETLTDSDSSDSDSD